MKRRANNPLGVVKVAPHPTATKGGGVAGARARKDSRASQVTAEDIGPIGLTHTDIATIELYLPHAVDRAVCTNGHITQADLKNPPLTCPYQAKNLAADGQVLRGAVCGGLVLKVRPADGVARAQLMEQLIPVGKAVQAIHYGYLKAKDRSDAIAEAMTVVLDAVDKLDLNGNGQDGRTLVNWVYGRARGRIKDLIRWKEAQGLPGQYKAVRNRGSQAAEAKGLGEDGDGVQAGDDGELGMRDIKALGRGGGIMAFESETADLASIIPAFDPEQEERGRELELQALKKALRELNPEDRKLILMVWGPFPDAFKEKSRGVKAVADLLGLSVSGVHFKVQEIYKKLRPLIDQKRRELERE